MYNYPFKENEEHVLNETENVNIKFAIEIYLLIFC